MRLHAAVVPSAPLLVPALAGGSAGQDAVLREAVRGVVRGVLAEDGPVTVVAAAPRTGQVEGTWDWSGFGVRARGGPGPGLPLGLAVGAWLLDEVDPARPRTLLGVAEDEGTEACRRLGEGLSGPLLVVGDGSARRSEKAPGHLDPRAEAFDAEAERALRDGDAALLLELSCDLARDLLAAGRAPWQVLAGAAAGRAVEAELLHAEAPYGVGYLVARWQVRS